MKKLIVIALAFLMLAGALSVSAVSDADNDILKVIAPVNKARAFSEYFGDDTKYGFDVKGYVDLGEGTELIGSTFDGYGYHTFLNVNGQNGAMSGMLNAEAGEDFDIATAISAMSYNCAGEDVQNIGGLNLKLENSFVGDGNLVKISYTVNNPTDEVAVFSLATTADVQVNNDDEAELKMLATGKGAKLMSAESNCVFTVDGAEGDLDSLWIGEWSDDYFVNMFGDSPDDAVFNNGDSAICWSWTNRTIAPMQTLNFYVLIEVGANTAPSVSVERTDSVFEDFIDVAISDPNLGTADLHYIINNGEEQVIEDVSLTEGEAVCPVSVEDLACGTSHSIKLWAIDDTMQASEELVIVFEKAHNFHIPRVVTAPTPDAAGSVEYLCSVCEYTYNKALSFGDLTLDAIANSLDAATVLKHDALMETGASPVQLMLGDVTGDGTINSLDAAQILKYDALLIEGFDNATFSYALYKAMCEDFYGYYEYDDVPAEDSSEGSSEGTSEESSEGPSEDISSDGSEDSSEDSSEEGTELDELIGSWTGMDAAGEPKNYVFFEDGTGTVAIGDIVYDVEWNIDGDSISIVKAQGDIAIYTEEATYAVIGDALALTDETGTTAVYIKDKEGYESTDLIGTWTCHEASQYFYEFTFGEDGIATIQYYDVIIEDVEWSIDGENLVVADEEINTPYKIVNDKLFITLNDDAYMFIKDEAEFSRDFDTDLVGHWVNTDAEGDIKTITFFEDNFAILCDSLTHATDGYTYANTMELVGELYAKYALNGDTLTLLHGNSFLNFVRAEFGVGAEAGVPEGKTNYAEGATYFVFADGVTADNGIYTGDDNTMFGTESFRFWGDTELNKLTDGVTADASKLNADGAQEMVSVIYYQNGKNIDIVLDLGETREDIANITFLGVRNGGDFGFDIFGTKIYASDDDENWGSSLSANFSATTVEVEEGTVQTYNFGYNLNATARGRYVKISLPATADYLQFDEILVLN